MRARVLFALFFVLGCGSTSVTPDLAAPAPGSDMAMTTTASRPDMTGTPRDLTGTTGQPDLAKRTPPPDLAVLDGSVGVTLYPLIVYNTVHWCDVTVTINGHATEFKAQDSMTFMAPAATTVMLSATPNPNFFPVKWTGVTTMSGATATYVMTMGANQHVTACCPTSAGGSGC